MRFIYQVYLCEPIAASRFTLRCDACDLLISFSRKVIDGSDPATGDERMQAYSANLLIRP